LCGEKKEEKKQGRETSRKKRPKGGSIIAETIRGDLRGGFLCVCGLLVWGCSSRGGKKKKTMQRGKDLDAQDGKGRGETGENKREHQKAIPYEEKEGGKKNCPKPATMENNRKTNKGKRRKGKTKITTTPQGGKGVQEGKINKRR